MENSTMSMKICLQFYWYMRWQKIFNIFIPPSANYFWWKWKTFSSMRIFTRVWVENGNLWNFHWSATEKWHLQWKAELSIWLGTNTNSPHNHHQHKFIIIQLRLLHISSLFICVVCVMFVSIFSHFSIIPRCSMLKRQTHTLTHKVQCIFHSDKKKKKYLPAIYICRVCVCFSV